MTRKLLILTMDIRTGIFLHIKRQRTTNVFTGRKKKFKADFKFLRLQQSQNAPLLLLTDDDIDKIDELPLFTSVTHFITPVHRENSELLI